MQKVIPVPPTGQGSVPPCVCAPFEPLISSAPVSAPDPVPRSLLQALPLPELRPGPELAIEPRSDDATLEEGILRSLSRRAARTVRPWIQGSRRQELWVAGFDEVCRAVDFRRLVPGPQGQLFATVPSVLGWAEATGARAFVLVQNQPGPRRAATSIDLSFTLQLAAAADLSRILFVDHVVVHNGGASTRLRERKLLPEVQAHAAHLQQRIGVLSIAHACFGLPQPSQPKATLP